MDSENTHHHEMKKKLKKRRKRTVITADEMVILESSFKNENRPDRFAKMRLAKQLGKNENFISIWFQNRRARERREKRLSASETTESSRDNIDPILLTKAVHSSYETEDQPLDLSKKPCSSNEEQIETLDTEMPVVRSPLFSRLIRMAAAAEGGILTTDCPYVSQAINDACRGILLNDGRILYDPVNGFEIELH